MQRPKSVARRFAAAMAPAYWARRQRALELAAYQDVCDHMVAGGELTVRGGPFAGLSLTPTVAAAAARWNTPPKLLGTYELEIQQELEREIQRGHRNVANIGCADGYYAAGLLRRLPGAELLAFDMDPEARKLCRETASHNGVGEGLSVEGECTIGTLAGADGPPSLLICDCEGCELELLDPAAVPWLRGATVIVELHDFAAPGVSEAVKRRFADTHVVSEFPVLDRDVRLADSEGLAADRRWLALAEFKRRDMGWAVLQPRAEDGA